MKRLIYADNAATTQLDTEAFEAMKPYMLHEFGNPSQKYAFSRPAREAIRNARAMIANCIGARPEEIVFTSGGTESDNWAVKSRKSDERIITSAFEHHAILNSCVAFEAIGGSVKYIRPTKDGTITPESLEAALTETTGLASIMLANNELGTIQPIRELSEISHKHGIPFHTDAVQAVGHIPVDVDELGIDMLSASAHKFHGPKGIGFLYIRKGTHMAPLVSGGTQEGGYRAGTENVPAIVGMAAALKKSCDGIHRFTAHINSLENLLLADLSTAEVHFIRNGGTNTLPGLISLSFPGKDGEAIMHRLDLFGVSVSTGSACDSHNTEISHVLRAINLDNEFAKGTIRISLGRNNTVQDAHEIALALIKVLSR